MVRFFLLNGFSRAWIPPVDDDFDFVDSCELVKRIQSEATVEPTNYLVSVAIVTLILIAFFAYIWIKFERKNYKKNS